MGQTCGCSAPVLLGTLIGQAQPLGGGSALEGTKQQQLIDLFVVTPSSHAYSAAGSVPGAPFVAASQHVCLRSVFSVAKDGKQAASAPKMLA